MKYIKKILSILLVASMLLTIVPAMAFADNEKVVDASELKVGDELVMKLSDGSEVEVLVIDPTNSNMDVDDNYMFVVTKDKVGYCTPDGFYDVLSSFYKKMEPDWDQYVVSTTKKSEGDAKYFSHTLGSIELVDKKVFMLSYLEQHDLCYRIKNSCVEYYLRNSFTELPFSGLLRKAYYTGLIYDGLLTDILYKNVRAAFNLDPKDLSFKYISKDGLYTKYEVVKAPVVGEKFDLAYTVKAANASVAKAVKKVNVSVTVCNWWKDGKFTPLDANLTNVALSTTATKCVASVPKFDVTNSKLANFPYFYSVTVDSYELEDGSFIKAGTYCPYDAVVTVTGGASSTIINAKTYPGIANTVWYDAKAGQQGAIAITIVAKNAAFDTLSFTDVNKNAWYYENVRFCVENGYMDGVSKTLFNPSGETSRAMVVTILWRMEGSPKATKPCTFYDVPSGMWYSEAVRWAQEKGIVDGYTAYAFMPNLSITREQLATMLYQYAQYKGEKFTASWMFLMPFSDTASIKSYATEAAQWCYMNKIINGIDGKFAPQALATRAQLAAMIERFCTVINK